ncbi:MAG: DUF2974 domain-containing protein [Clostridia bacterium]|nr:DUF2974 domain-containing protein [Clostridia bacterium]
MANVFDYLRWRGDLSFGQSPICEIDALIFSELSYIFFDGIIPGDIDEGRVTLSEAAEIFFERNADREVIKLGEIVPDEIVDLFRMTATSKRFAEVELGHFIDIVDNETVEQFSALSFFISDDLAFIAYRGTDDSITGWREDFRMAFLTPVPAQKRAEEYLLETASDFGGRIILGGHSKGGNLALWAGLNAPDEICDRIEKIYNFDGPGFLDDVWESAGYERIADRISTVIPTGSVVGLLLKYDKNYRVTRSSAKKYLYQHDALTWNVLGCEFECDEDVAPDVKKTHERVGRWIYSMEPEKREAFVEGFFDILSSTNAKTLTALAESRSDLVRAFSNIDPETKQALMTGIRFFVGEGYSAFFDQLKSFFKKKDDEDEAIEEPTAEPEEVIPEPVKTVKKKVKVRKKPKTKAQKIACAVRRRSGLCKKKK